MTNILIVDDEMLAAKQVRTYLSNEGYSSTFILKPAVLFQMLGNKTFDLILMDINMPDINGVTLLKELKKHPVYHKIPVIMLTGDTNEQILSTCFEMGAIDYITKPISELILKARINSALMIKATEEELERRVEQRTKELEEANKELKNTTQQMIQSAKLSALGELSAGVAHEMRQPLNVIKILNQSLLRDISKNCLNVEELIQNLEQITAQVNKMAEIIDHMRVFSRRSADEKKINVQVNHVVESTLKFFSMQLKENNIDLVNECQNNLSEVSGDPIQLEQLLMNLLMNARHAVEKSSKSNKQIRVRSYKIAAQTSPIHKDAVSIEISDNGGGIPAHLEDKIFDQFFTTKPAGEGTGIGLSISKKIIREHAGVIELENKIGEGAIFRVILPVCDN